MSIFQYDELNEGGALTNKDSHKEKNKLQGLANEHSWHANARVSCKLLFVVT